MRNLLRVSFWRNLAIEKHGNREFKRMVEHSFLTSFFSANHPFNMWKHTERKDAFYPKTFTKCKWYVFHTGG